MSVRFCVTRLVVTTGPAPITNHDGEETVNADCPTGTFLAYDRKQRLYRCTKPEYFQDLVSGEAELRKGQLWLYRDYWEYVASDLDTPYGASFRLAPHRLLN